MNHTQKTILSLKQNVDKVKYYLDISMDDYRDMEFELGCQLLEVLFPNEKTRHKHLTEKQRGFWSYFIFKNRGYDEHLNYKSFTPDPEKNREIYRRQKEAWVKFDENLQDGYYYKITKR